MLQQRAEGVEEKRRRLGRLRRERSTLAAHTHEPRRAPPPKNAETAFFTIFVEKHGSNWLNPRAKYENSHRARKRINIWVSRLEMPPRPPEGFTGQQAASPSQDEGRGRKVPGS